MYTLKALAVKVKKNWKNSIQNALALPFISPLLFTITPALSSKYINTPSFLL